MEPEYSLVENYLVDREGICMALPHPNKSHCLHANLTKGTMLREAEKKVRLEKID